MTSIRARNVNHPDHRENLKAEKYNVIREAMLESLSDEAWMSFSDLEDKVRAWLSEWAPVPRRCPTFAAIHHDIVRRSSRRG